MNEETVVPVTPVGETGTETPTTPITSPPATPQETTQGGLSHDELKRITEGEILKSLGLQSFDQLKETVEAHRAFQESQKSEAQRQAEQLAALQEQLAGKDSEVFNLNARLAAVQSGVQPNALDDVIVLAQTLVKDDVTIDQAISKVIEKYPHFTASAQAPTVPTFSTGKSGVTQMSETDKWLAAFKN